MKFVMILIQLILIHQCTNAQATFNSSLIESDQSRDEQMKVDYVNRIQRNLKLTELIQQLKQVDNIKTPNKVILEGIQNILNTNNLLKIKEYKRTDSPQDIQAIAFYDYLKELDKKLEKFLSIIKQAQDFFSGIEVSIKNLIDILQKIDESLNKIKQDKQYSDSQPQNKNKFGPKQQQIIKHQSNENKVSKPISAVELNTSFKWEYKEIPPIQVEKCDSQITKLNEEYIFFLKIQETLLFISQQQQIDPLFQKLIPFQSLYQINGKIVSDFVNSLNLKNLDEDSLRYIDQLQKIYQNNNEFFIQIRKFDNLASQTLKLLNLIQPLQDFGNLLIRQILNLYDKINVIKEIYAYQPDQVYKQLQQLDRDYKICKGSQTYEIIKDIKIPKNTNQQKVGDQNYIIPPIKTDQCQKRINDIEENLFEFIKKKILTKIDDAYKKFLDDDFHQTFMYGYNPGIWKDRIRRFQSMNLDYFDKFQTKLVKFAEYQSNYKPDDPQSVAAYENLIALNNKIWQISNFFEQAKSFIAFQKANLGMKGKLQELTTTLKSLSQKQLDTTTISNYVLEQEIFESFRDYTICTGKDFYEANKIVPIQQRFILEQNKKSNLIIIEESNNQGLKNKNKQRSKSKKAIKTSLNKEPQKFSFIQLQGNWKYYDYPPILKNECQDELNIIKEDILQFRKIQVLLQYQKSQKTNYNKIIDEFLELEELFIENMRFTKLSMEFYDLERNVISFDNIPKSKQYNNPAFDELLIFNKYLMDVKDAYQKAKGVLNLNRDDFSIIRFNLYILNEYLDKDFKYQPDDVEKELKQLYRDYQICTGRLYESEKIETQKVIHQSFSIKDKKSKNKMNKKNKKYQKTSK